jgi:hypothetical protein
MKHFPALLFSFITIFLAPGCKKKTVSPAQPENPKAYVSKMGGVRTWSGTLFHSYFHDNGLHLSPYINEGTDIATDTFAVTVYDTATISALGEIFAFFSVDTTAKMIAFVSTVPTGTNGIFDSIKYYYLRDSIYYFSYYHQSKWPNDSIYRKRLFTM